MKPQNLRKREIFEALDIIFLKVSTKIKRRRQSYSQSSVQEKRACKFDYSLMKINIKSAHHEAGGVEEIQFWPFHVCPPQNTSF